MSEPSDLPVVVSHGGAATESTAGSATESTVGSATGSTAGAATGSSAGSVTSSAAGAPAGSTAGAAAGSAAALVGGVAAVPTNDEPAGLPPELARLRHSIDNIDAALIYLLAERFKATKQVGVLKARQGLPASDPGREERQVARLRALADSADLDPVFAEKFLAFIVEEVIRHHEALAQDHAPTT